MKQGYGVYESTSVDTADQGKLILIAYDVAIKHCKLSLDCFGDHHLVEQRTRHLFKVQDAITELMGALKMDGGEIGKNLYRLYEYMIYCLVQANIHNAQERVTEVLNHMQSLRSAWQQAIVTLKCQARPEFEAVSGHGVAILG